jgi:hypothetical protein
MSISSSANGTDTMPNAGEQQHESFSDAVARIERLGKSLFGVTVCVVHLHGEGSELDTQAHQYCAQLPLNEALQVMPEKSSPFSAALGKIDNFEVRFYALHPLRNRAGNIVGRVALIHERSRAFTAGDAHWMTDLVALLERELHFSAYDVEAHSTISSNNCSTLKR